MPRAPSYNPATSGAAPVSARLQAPQFVESGLGQGLERAGQALLAADHADDVIAQDYARQLRLDFKKEADPLYNDYTTRTGKNAVDTGADTQDQISKLHDKIMQSAGNDRQRKFLAPMLAADAQDYLSGIGRHSAQQGKVMLVGTAKSEQETFSNEAIGAYADTARHDKAIGEALGATLRFGQLMGYSDEQTAAKAQQVRSGIRAGTVQQAIGDGDLEIAGTYLSAHADEMTPDDRRRAVTAFHVAQKSAEIEVQRADALVNKQMTDGFAALKTRASQGEDVSKELPQYVAYFGTKGDQSAVEEARKLVRDSAFSKTWSQALPIQRQNRVAALTGIPEDKRTRDQQAELQWLKEHRGSLDSQFSSDPVGFFAENGRPGEQPPPLDNTVESYQRRAQWAKSVGAASPLSNVELDGLHTKMQAGGNGYQQVADVLGTFDGAMAAAAAQKIAPNDKFLHQVVTIPHDARLAAINGQAVLASDKKAIAVESVPQQTRIDNVKRGFDRALAAMPQDQKNGILKVADAIAAFEVHQTGAQMDSVVYERALNRALGGVGTGQNRTGGLGGWGPNRQYFLVPDGMTMDQFASRVAGFMKAYQKYPNAPVNPDGTPADLRMATPVAIGPRKYKWMVGDKVVMGRDKKPFVMVLSGN